MNMVFRIISALFGLPIAPFKKGYLKKNSTNKFILLTVSLLAP